MDKHTVRSSVDGSIDVKASVAQYTNALLAAAASEVSTETIVTALDQVFDSVEAGKRLTIPVLLSKVTSLIEHDKDDYTALERRVRAVIKGSPRFDSSKGVGGGVERLALEGETLLTDVAKSA